MKKGIVSIAFLAFLVLALAACGDNNNSAQAVKSTPRADTGEQTPPQDTQADTGEQTPSQDTQADTLTPQTGNNPPANLAEESAEMFTYQFVNSGEICNSFGFKGAETFQLETSGIVLTMYHGNLKQVRIPGTIEGFPIVGIASETFEVGTEIFPPDSIEFFIPGWRFGENVPEHLIIPYGVTHMIGMASHSQVEHIRSVDIPPTVTMIDDSAFAGFKSLTGVTIPDSVTTIGDGAFWINTALLRVDISNQNSLVNVHAGAFNNTSWLAAQPTGVVYLGTVALGYKVDSDQNGLGLDANSMQGHEMDPTPIEIRKGTTVIADQAFNLIPLTNVVIPDSVTHIGDQAFWGNDLASITIANSATLINNETIGSNRLTTITYPDGATQSWIGRGYFENDERRDITIPDSITHIGDGAFSHKNLTNVTIPDSVTYIGRDAFFVNYLTSVTIPKGVTHIGFRAFCDNDLTSVTIPDSVTFIGDGAFVNNQLDEASKERIRAINPSAIE